MVFLIYTRTTDISNILRTHWPFILTRNDEYGESHEGKVKRHPVTSATVARVRIDDERTGPPSHHQYRHISKRGYPPPASPPPPWPRCRRWGLWRGGEGGRKRRWGEGGCRSIGGGCRGRGGVCGEGGWGCRGEKGGRAGCRWGGGCIGAGGGGRTRRTAGHLSLSTLRARRTDSHVGR